MPAATEQCVKLGHVRSGGDNSQCYTCLALEAGPGGVTYVPEDKLKEMATSGFPGKAEKPPLGARRALFMGVDPASPDGDNAAYCLREGDTLYILYKYQYDAIMKIARDSNPRQSA